MKTKTLGFPILLLLAAACGAADDTLPAASSGAGGSATSGTAGSTTDVASAAGSGGAAASSATSAATTSGGTGGMAGTGGGTPTGGDASSLPAKAAQAVCGALFRCCDAASQKDLFAPLVADMRLAAFAKKLPPNASFASATDCTKTLTEIFALAPFGDWVAAAANGSVGYDVEAADACAKTLDTAACGAPVTAALLDGTCFGYAAPAGGSEQRAMFQRTAAAGADCAPIRDGIGSTFYGNCDPSKAFCCYADPTKPGTCALPFDAKGTPRAGACKAASALGEACDLLKNVQLCKTGDSCDTTTAKCVASKEGPLAKGAVCIDKSYNLLGTCVDSYCDVLGTKKCEALKADGATCNGYDQCASGSCDKGVCAASTFCKG